MGEVFEDLITIQAVARGVWNWEPFNVVALTHMRRPRGRVQEAAEARDAARGQGGADVKVEPFHRCADATAKLHRKPVLRRHEMFRLKLLCRCLQRRRRGFW
jgi:hypothetical protein